MRTVHLLNSAVMPHGGCYVIDRITANAFKESLIKVVDDTNIIFKHYIGYENTLNVLKLWTGVNLEPTNVDETEMQDLDEFLVCRLARRLSGSDKIRTMHARTPLSVEDFHFYHGTYYQEIPVLNP